LASFLFPWLIGKFWAVNDIRTDTILQYTIYAFHTALFLLLIRRIIPIQCGWKYTQDVTEHQGG
jgi:hypothetical protein